MKIARWMLMVALVCASAGTRAAAPAGYEVQSPGKMLRVVVARDGDGRLEYSISRRAGADQWVQVVAPSRLGFILGNAEKLDRNFTAGEPQYKTVDQAWEQPWGERRHVREHYQEMFLPLRQNVFRGASVESRQLGLRFRVFDDGIGFRYEFPGQPQLAQVAIVDELTEFAIAQPATAWWIPGGEWNRYEYLYNRTPLDQLSQAHTPMTMKLANGVHVAIHEAALVDYAGMWLRRVEGQRLKAVLSPSSSGAKVTRAAPFNTPWRTLQIAGDAAGLYMSDLILNLNEPNKLGDVSWVKPFKYVGVWWGMHLGSHTWSSGEKHGATTAETRRYIDFAAAQGFRGVLVEGWNKGWDGNWFANGAQFSFTEPYPDFDLAGLAAYAKKKGVRLVGHHETGGHIANYEKQLGAALDLYQELGVDSVKTGYVADAGGIMAQDADGRIHFEWHDGQVQSRHHLLVVQEAAKRRIAVNPHEPIKDTGLRRTYPNWVAREGARGMEYNAWGDPPNPPEHEVNLVFTRMLSGPMDYTPGVLSLVGANGKRIPSTIARQLALYVVIYSPIQMAADLPENYAKFPRPFRFIKDVPVDWSETRVLNGEVGDYATLARKDRASDDWYLGAITDESPRRLSVSLAFLDAGRRYTATIYRDGKDAGFAGDPTSIEIETRPVSKHDTLTLDLAPGGGTAIRIAAPRKAGAARRVSKPEAFDVE
jgi:alpha-glucosidase